MSYCYYDDERDKTEFRNTTPDLQDQDHVCKTKTKTRPIFRSQTGLVVRPTVSDHIAEK